MRKGQEVRHYHVYDARTSFFYFSLILSFVFNDLAIFARQVTRASSDFAILVNFAGLQITAHDEKTFKLSGKGVQGELLVQTDNTGERDAWMKDISSYVELIRLNENADKSIRSGATLQILRAQYGDLSAKPKDVTNQVIQVRDDDVLHAVIIYCCCYFSHASIVDHCCTRRRTQAPSRESSRSLWSDAEHLWRSKQVDDRLHRWWRCSLVSFMVRL